MGNPHYQKGARFERTVKARLEADGYFVTKSGGSKSLVDLVAVKEGRVLFVQVTAAVKPKSKAEQRALRDLASDKGASPVLWTKAGPEFLEEAA
jgi:Holliday junction resolvase